MDGETASKSSMGESVFNPQYRELNEDEKFQVQDIKNAAMEMYNLIDGVAEMQAARTTRGAREFALAKTKLEEAVMWAVKGITK